MTLGKREQIVMGVIVALSTVFVLHLFIFAPRASSFKAAKASYEAAAQQVQSQRIISDPNELTSFTKRTEQLVQDLSVGIRQLRMEQPEAFVPLLPESIKVPEGTPPDQVETVRTSMLDLLKADAHTTQTSMTLGQIDRLQRFASSDPKYSFFGQQGWALPTELPPAMQTAQLWDTLTQIAQSKDTLGRLTQGTQAYANLLNRYHTLLNQIGLNVTTARGLTQFGEFVPLFYRMSVANLILKQMPPDRPIIILQEVFTRERLFELLEIELPFDPEPGMPDNVLYIVYSQLENLNNLLQQAREYQMQDISSVVLPAYGYLRQQDMLPLPTKGIVDPSQLPQDDIPQDEAQKAAAAAGMMGGAMMPGMGLPGMLPGGPASMPGMLPGGPAAMPGMPGGDPAAMPGLGAPGGDPNAVQGDGSGPVPGGGMMMPGAGGMFNMGAGAAGTPGAPVVERAKPAADEIGYAIPIKMTVIADNVRTWRFVYEVLRSQPLVELNRMMLRSLSERDPNNTNIEATVTYIFVPKLFGTLDTVRQLLDTIGQEGATPGAAPGMPPGVAQGIPGAPGAPGLPMPGMPPGIPATPPMPGPGAPLAPQPVGR